MEVRRVGVGSSDTCTAHQPGPVWNSSRHLLWGGLFDDRAVHAGLPFLYFEYRLILKLRKKENRLEHARFEPAAQAM